MLNRFEVGQEIINDENYEIISILTNKTISVKIGDKGYVDSNGIVVKLIREII